MKILLDTNIVIDYFLDRQPFSDNTLLILQGAQDALYEIFVTSNAITDIYYILRKKIFADAARNVIRNLLALFQIIPVGEIECRMALNAPISDFEDALMTACATRNDVDYIVTRDAALLKQCALAIAPVEFLRCYKRD